MIQLLSAIFLFGVLALVIGCGVYLFATRRQGEMNQEASPPEISREVLRRAAELDGTYRLSDLETILARLASLEARGVILDLQLKTEGDVVQIRFDQNRIELFSNNLGVLDDYLDRFRRGAARADLEVHPFAGQKDVCYVEITGSWREIAATMRRVIGEIYNLGDNTEVDVSILR